MDYGPFFLSLGVNVNVMTVSPKLLPTAVALLSLVSCVRGSDLSSRLLAEEHWDGIIANYADCRDSVNIRELSTLNLALAHKGRLADDAFKYTQAFSGALIPEWGWDLASSALLSDIYYESGQIALAQKYAFEGNVCAEGAYDAGMMKRLVQNNMIYGAYDVAEKYISRLEKDRATRDWAESQRRFLGDDAAVEADPEYGPRRACIPAENFVANVRGADEDLKDIIRANPSYRPAVEYLGIYYLLDCDFDAFRAFLDEFYGTEALPELPLAFQEAACMMSSAERGYWKQVGVDPAVNRRYGDFARRLSTGLDMEKYSDTFWYYVMRVNSI